MKTIYKYELKKESTQLIDIPSNSQVLSIEKQNGAIYMWALVETEMKAIQMRIDMFGTGERINVNTSNYDYLATVQDGDFVWHFLMVYEK